LISIVVPTRDRAALLARLLESLARLHYPHWEAIVVDDGSTDDTAAVVDRYRSRGLPITYLYQPWSKMGAARNLGIRYARGEIVAFTDDDCMVDPGWLDGIVEAFEANPRALGVQGETVTIPVAMTPLTHQVEKHEPGPPYHTCNVAYRREVLCELGGFDTKLIRAEDVVLAMRVLERGPIDFAPQALVIHPPRPKQYAGRRAWRMLMESELHFNHIYPHYLPVRHPTLAIERPRHVVTRWLILPIRRHWRWHLEYCRNSPREYLRHLPSIAYEKLSLISLLPFFLRRWRRVVGRR
jgi:glycosyltransferase involved in cell wall biosynthesis